MNLSKPTQWRLINIRGRYWDGWSKQGPVAGGDHHTYGKAKHCIKHPLAYISSCKYCGCSQSSHGPGETCRQKGLDNRVEVLQESYYILKSLRSLFRQDKTGQLFLSFFDLKYFSRGRSQICKINRIMKGISRLIWIFCARLLVNSPNVRGSTILYSVIPNPVMR